MIAPATTPTYTPERTRNIVLLLAGSTALMMTGFGIIMPVFARRLGEFGDGVAALGWMTMAFALSQLIAAPIMGSLTDKYGRRPFVLIALFAFMLTNIGYLLAQSTPQFIAVRVAGGALTAGLFPAAMGIVADIVPEENRARWIGIIMGGYGVGFIFGPALGGFLYDGWGFAAPFILSAAMSFLALTAAFILVPETHPPSARTATKQKKERMGMRATAATYWHTLPRPLSRFVTLLFIDFVGSFAFAFIEPQMVFYFYDDLGWSTTRFGVVVGAYGLAMVFGQLFLARSSDKYGRKPIIVVGILTSSLLYIGLRSFTAYAPIVLGAMTAGLGSSLIAPAASAFYLDITDRAHQGRIVGLKEAALALGGVMGPLSVIAASKVMGPYGIFTVAAGLVLMSALTAVFFLHEDKNPHPTSGG